MYSFNSLSNQTHASIQGYEMTCYERLEFIGDAILDFRKSWRDHRHHSATLLTLPQWSSAIYLTEIRNCLPVHLRY